LLAVSALPDLQIDEALAALEFAVGLTECTDAEAFATQIGLLERLIGAESALVSSCEGWAPTTTIEAGDPSVYTPDLMAATVPNWRDHPVLAHDVVGGGHGARRVSDFLSAREWRRRPLFNDFYRPLGMSWELSAQLAWGPAGSSCCVTLHRDGRDFDRREMALLDAVTPHLRAARARVTPRAGTAATDGRSVAPDAGPSAAQLGRRLSLTARQAEVLLRLAAGRTNAGIAADLGISVNTVARHVEAIYRRLGVNTRVAAARVALDG